jgi:hypothetical protein
MMPKASARYARDPTEKSIRFLIRMLQAFFARVKPVSTMAKSACVKKTQEGSY